MKDISTKNDGAGFSFLTPNERGMKRFLQRSWSVVTVLSLLTVGVMLSACGSGGETSAQIVSGTVAVGAALSGQVSLKDSANPSQAKTTIIGPDGSFAFDVTTMKTPFILRADGQADGRSYRMHSFAAGPGIANVNPFSEALVTSAAEDEDAEEVYLRPDAAKLEGIKNRIEISVSDLLEQLRPLLKRYNADGRHPISDRFVVDHHGLDGVLDHVNVSIIGGILTITNKETGAVIYTGSVRDIRHGHFTDDDDDLPQPPSVPTAPITISGVGGVGQVTLSWKSVSNATAYNLYYATRPGVTIANGTKISAVTTPYVQTGLAAGSTFYYMITALNSAGESAGSVEISATTAVTEPLPILPTKPGNVIALGGTRQVTLSWSPVTNATSYNLYYSTGSNGVTTANGILVTDVTSPAVLGDLTAGTTYNYIVTAVNSAGESAASEQVAATTLIDIPSPTLPAVPTGVTAVGGTDRATITWVNVAGADSYNLYWSATADVNKSNGTKVAGVSSPYVKTGLSAGTTYYFIVAAANSIGESAPSNLTMASTNAPPLAVPNAPTGVTLVGGDKQISIAWPAVTGATSYNLYWSTTSGVTTSSIKITNAVSPYLQNGLAPSSAYYYIVTAVNASGQSVASAQATTTTSAPAVVMPTAPTAVTATGGIRQVSLTWSTVATATSYNLYWSTTAGVTTAASKIAGVTSPYLQNGLAEGMTYYYIVTAVNSAGEGAASAQRSATTNVAAPLACGSCHAIPPATGKHSFHVTNQGIACATCHGSGYSSTTVNATTHNNGVSNVTLSVWNAASRSCASYCHGSKPW